MPFSFVHLLTACVTNNDYLRANVNKSVETVSLKENRQHTPIVVNNQKNVAIQSEIVLPIHVQHIETMASKISHNDKTPRQVRQTTS